MPKTARAQLLCPTVLQIIQPSKNNMATTVSVVLLMNPLELATTKSRWPVSFALSVYIIIHSPSLTHRQANPSQGLSPC